ncbi:MAG: hypothetical protein NTU77_02260 [Actinobacteria bacterium]|nr:hypothetical protein [Actinomycetota bacterium]
MDVRDGWIGLVPQRRVGVGLAPPGLRRILAGRSVHPVERLSLRVIRLEVGVGEGPGGRDSGWIVGTLEIPLPQAREAGPVDLRVSSDEVVHTGPEVLAVVIDPGLVRLVPALDEDSLGRPVLSLSRQVVASLEHKHIDAAAREAPRKRAATHAAPHDHHRGGVLHHCSI